MHRDTEGPSAATPGAAQGVGMGDHDMGGALHILKRGGAVSRRGWNGRNQRLQLQVPDCGSKMTLPYVYIVTVQGDLVPWLCSQTDLLASDWYEVPLTVSERSGR